MYNVIYVMLCLEIVVDKFSTRIFWKYLEMASVQAVADWDGSSSCHGRWLRVFRFFDKYIWLEADNQWDCLQYPKSYEINSTYQSWLSHVITHHLYDWMCLDDTWPLKEAFEFTRTHPWLIPRPCSCNADQQVQGLDTWAPRFDTWRVHTPEFYLGVS